MPGGGSVGGSRRSFLSKRIVSFIIHFSIKSGPSGSRPFCYSIALLESHDFLEVHLPPLVHSL